jgi:DNA mismatch repair protein MLH1
VLSRGCFLLCYIYTQTNLFAFLGLREELFYQLGLRQFGNFNWLKLEPPPPLRAMVKLAVDAEEGTKHSRLTRPQIVDVR